MLESGGGFVRNGGGAATQPLGHLMKKLLSLVALCLSLALGVAHAADENVKTPQQMKMGTCNADAKAKELKGDERKAFMKECLSAKPAAAAVAAAVEGKAARQSKMKMCNDSAKDMKGADRNNHMKECLSAK